MGKYNVWQKYQYVLIDHHKTSNKISIFKRSNIEPIIFVFSFFFFEKYLHKRQFGIFKILVWNQKLLSFVTFKWYTILFQFKFGENILEEGQGCFFKDFTMATSIEFYFFDVLHWNFFKNKLDSCFLISCT
jgi:hypothetical protein